jgi:hypothetical protein
VGGGLEDASGHDAFLKVCKRALARKDGRFEPAAFIICIYYRFLCNGTG